jgi:hypothetical protein
VCINNNNKIIKVENYIFWVGIYIMMFERLLLKKLKMLFKNAIKLDKHVVTNKETSNTMLLLFLVSFLFRFFVEFKF